MRTPNKRRRIAERSTLRWAVAGAAFGAAFPAIAAMIRTVELGWAGAQHAIETDPLLWIIASAPVFLGAFAAAGGRQNDRVRSFSDTLAERVEERTAQLSRRNEEMRIVFDTVDQAFITIDLEGGIGMERSRAFADWFGVASGPVEMTFPDLLGELNLRAGQSLDVGLDQVRSAVFPIDVALDQLPGSFEVGENVYKIAYRPTGTATDVPESLLVVVSDATAEVKRERLEARQKEMFRLFERSKQDRAGLISFLRDGDALVEQVSSGVQGDGILLRRSLHTLKGNAGLMGLDTIARVCHKLEESLASSGFCPAHAERLATDWKSMRAGVDDFIDFESDAIRVERDDYEAALEAIAARRPLEEIEQLLRNWRLELSEKALGRLGEQAAELAVRLGKGDVEVVIEGNDVRLQPEQWSDFWGVLIHVVRNAVDHGLETPTERAQTGKSRPPRIVLRTVETASELEVVIEDDGRGIDWDRLREKCVQQGLPCSDHEHLVDALFHDGISTREEVTTTSGRGVGMAAVRGEIRKLGGDVQVTSTPGQGTRWTFLVPKQAPLLAA